MVRVPLSVDARIIAQHHARDPKTRLPLADDVLAELGRAFQRANDTCAKIETAVQAIMSDQSRPLAARMIDAKKTIMQLAETATKSLDAAKSKAAKELVEIYKASSPPPEPNNAGEIRQALRSLPQAERAAIIAAAIETGDHATSSAMLNAPSWLSGLSEAERTMRLQAWRKVHHGELFQREARLNAALVDFDRGTSAFLGFVGASMPDANRAEAAAEAANAAIADATKTAIEDKQQAAE
ncbi:MAG: hypothetical protein Q8M31_19350 [Beijerinckiaceae bacterium]|nr:hypothetical protein [Beijerinckiaceae bacterium]